MNKDPTTRLYERMEAEQQQYRDWLLTQSPDEILNHTYEYTIRQDILMAMEDMELSDKQAQTLLKSPCPLADVYQHFRDQEHGHMEHIKSAIETRANKFLRDESIVSRRAER